MMRNKYPIEMEESLRKKQKTHTLLQMLNHVKNVWGYEITADMLRSYLSKRKIRYKDYKESKVRNNGLPIGTERATREDGMVMVKTKGGWDYKQRVIWEQHNGKIPKNHYIIFLDGNRENYNIDNLACVSSRESSVMANCKMFFDEADLTQVGIDIAKLIVLTKEKSGITTKSHKRRRNK